MSLVLPAPNEPRSIAAAAQHRRLGSAWTGALVSVALAVSICTLVLVIGTSAASALPRHLIVIDDGNSSLVVFAVIGIGIVMMLLAAFAFNGLTPGHARRRRSRR
jgi:hypothetical protein